MTDAPSRVLRGRVLAPDPDRRVVRVLPDATIRLDAGGIVDVASAASDCPVPETWPGAVILPGFVDTHLHFPQTRIVGSASGPLLTWLRSSVFPEEARFSDHEYAEAVAATFCRAMLSHGTTAAAVYSSSHEAATDALFAALDRSGLRGMAGLTLMNRGAPTGVLHEADAALAAAERLIARWHGHDGRLRFCVTPRFALSCDAELLRRAGALARDHALWAQTHLSENPDELTATAAAFPDSADYLDVYERVGLVTDRAILAHCIHLSDDEWRRMVDHDAVVSHCPDSNFFLGSGCMRLAEALDRGLRVGLGTDVGAGRTFSVPRVAASAYDASLVVGAPVPAEELLWLATRGGARALGLDADVGCVAAGFEADLTVVDLPEHLGLDVPDYRLFDAILFRHDNGPVRATLTRGQLRHGDAGA